MWVLVAMDSFKGCLSSAEAGAAVACGIERAAPGARTEVTPLADGGEGTVAAFLAAAGGRQVPVRVSGPLFDPVEVACVVLPDKTVVIEAAAVVGLHLVPEAARQPGQITTLGLGEIIRFAVQKGYRQFIIGLGGSASHDAGLGLLTALGWRFTGHDGREVNPVGASLMQIAALDDSGVMKELRYCRFTIMADVNNPLYGPRGAARVFAPQKGANQAEVEELEQGTRHFAGLVASHTGRDVSDRPGTGAAGGLGFALAAFLGASLQPAATVLFPRLRLEEKIAAADWVVTGEGRLDGQTAHGKMPLQIARLAARHNKPVVALAGEVTPEASRLYDQGITAMFAIAAGPAGKDALMNGHTARELLAKRAEDIARLLKLFIDSNKT